MCYDKTCTQYCGICPILNEILNAGTQQIQTLYILGTLFMFIYIFISRDHTNISTHTHTQKHFNQNRMSLTVTLLLFGTRKRNQLIYLLMFKLEKKNMQNAETSSELCSFVFNVKLHNWFWFYLFMCRT